MKKIVFSGSFCLGVSVFCWAPEYRPRQILVARNNVQEDLPLEIERKYIPVFSPLFYKYFWRKEDGGYVGFLFQRYMKRS